MSWQRDEQMFREHDSFGSGYRDGRREGELVVKLVVASALGVDKDVIDMLMTRDVNQHLVGLTTVFTSLEQQLAEAHNRNSMFISPDPSEVAEIVIAEQTDFSEKKEIHDPLDYCFEADEETGVVRIVTKVIPLYDMTEEEDLNALWIQSRLNKVGVDRDVPFCSAVTDRIIRQLVETNEVVNG